jgi:predicted dehydrogenase
MLKIGIIGSGFGVIGLLPAFDSIKNCKIVAICAKESAALKHYTEYAGAKKIYRDWRLLLEYEDLDALVIAVTPNAQYHIAKAAIGKGIHVFAEKPLAATLAQARELLALAKKKKIIHGTNFIWPEIPEWKKAKELIDNKTFGALQHLSVNWDWLSNNIKNQQPSWKTQVKEGGGVLAFSFAHGLHYMEHFGGKITQIKSLFSYTPLTKDGEAGVDMLLRFKSGATGHAHVSSNSPGRVEHQLIFQCERGVIVLGSTNTIVDKFTITTHTQKGTKQLSVKKVQGKKGEDERVKMVKILARRFVEACITHRQMTPSFAEGLRVQELIEQIRAEKIK